MIATGVTGALAANLLNRTAPLADSLAGQAILTGQPSLVTGGRRAERRYRPDDRRPPAVGEQVRGALMLGRLATGPGFTETDLDMAASFAGHAAVAMELAQARIDQGTLAQAEDHDRIAGDRTTMSSRNCSPSA